MPMISVVTTTFNRDSYLKQALRSTLAQTYDDFEVLVCDDAASMATSRLCESFQDQRIVYSPNSKRLGIARNTFNGAMRARGEFLSILNDDDLWTPNFLERCVQPLTEDRRVVLSFADHWLINSDGLHLEQETDDNSRLYGRAGLSQGIIEQPWELISKNSVPLAMASIFRKSAVDWQMYSGKIRGSYDYFLSYCLVRSGGKVAYVNERLTEYRIHSSNATEVFNAENTKGSLYVAKLILRDRQAQSIKREIWKQYAGMKRHLLGINLRRFNLMEALYQIFDFGLAWLSHRP